MQSLHLFFKLVSISRMLKAHNQEKIFHLSEQKTEQVDLTPNKPKE